MSRGQKVVNFVRTVMSISSAIIGIVSFFLMVCVNDNYEGWFKLELLLLGIFALSVVVGAVADDPNRLLRHLFAITFCIFAFAYRRLHINCEATYCCNKMRRKLDGYPRLYVYALEKYDDKLYKDFDSYDEYEEC